MIAAQLEGADYGILAAVVVLIGFSSLLALAETGLVRTSKARAQALEKQRKHGARTLARLVEDPESFLHPVLLLVLICQLVASSLVGVIADRLFGTLGLAAGIVFEIVVIFVFGEAVPKNWAVLYPDRAALRVAPFVDRVIRFPPVRFVAAALTAFSHLFVRDKSGNPVEAEVMESELLALADVAVEADVIEEEERELLSSIIEFGDTIVREVMAPRPDVIAVSEKEAAGDVLERAIAEGLSRIPVYRGSVDDIVGIAYTRDLVLAVRASGAEGRPVGQLARPANYVPEQKRVAPLLREMQRKQFHLAVVVDEYGGTAGIVTLEDLIEELVGEIADEFDTDEPEVEILGTELRVPGRMSIDDVNEIASVELPNGDWDTIAGLLLHLRGQPPAEGESIVAGDVELIADRVQGRRIRTVRIIRRDSDARGAQEAGR